MFKRFVDEVSRAITTKELDGDLLEAIGQDLLLGLVESDVHYEVAMAIVDELKKRLIGKRVPRFGDARQIVVDELKSMLYEILSKRVYHGDLVREALSRPPGSPLKIVFFGVNGVGKTTTIAKIAYLFKTNGVTPVVVAADTFRAGAQEQLKEHAKRLGVPFIGGKYGADPASVAYDAIEYARARGYRVVLVDTAGRMHVDEDLMNELRKVVRVVKPDYRILIIDALTGADAIEQAKVFNESVGVDLVVVTKIDADVKGGAIISVCYTIDKPIAFIGTGQGYSDLKKFDAAEFTEKLVEGLRKA